MDRVKGVVFTIVGAAILIGAILSAFGVKRFIAESIVVQGKVTRLNAGGSHPEVGFTTMDGRSLTFPEGGLIGGFKANDAVKVRYRAADPDTSAQLDSFGSLWFWPITLAVFGVVFMLGGVLSFRN